MLRLSGTRLLVVDFDNTLFFTDSCNALASKELFGRCMSLHEIRALPKPEKNKVYRLTFSKYMHMCKPNRRLIRRLSKEHDAVIIVLTGQSREGMPVMQRLLECNGVNYDRLVMRLKSELRKKDERWKLERIQRLAKGYVSVELYEDKADNIAYILGGVKRNRVSAFLVTPRGIKPSDGLHH